MNLKFILLLYLFFLLPACKQSSCMTYSEAIEKGLYERKTTTLVMNKDTLELDYVRDQMYKDSIPFCYGNLDLEKEDFERVTKDILKGYNPENVRAVHLFSEGRDICNSDTIDIDAARYLYILRTDDKNNGIIDFLDLETGQKKITPRVWFLCVSKYPPPHG